MTDTEKQLNDDPVARIIDLTTNFQNMGSRVFNATDPTPVDELSIHLADPWEIESVLLTLEVFDPRHTTALTATLVQVALGSEVDHSAHVGSLIGRIARSEREGPTAPAVYSSVQHNPTTRTLRRAVTLLTWAGLPRHAQATARLVLELGDHQTRTEAMRFLDRRQTEPGGNKSDPRAVGRDSTVETAEWPRASTTELGGALLARSQLEASIDTLRPHPHQRLVDLLDRFRPSDNYGRYITLLRVLPVEYTLAQGEYLLGQSLSQARRGHILPLLNKIEPEHRETLIGAFARSTFDSEPDLVEFHLIQDLLLFTGLEQVSQELAATAMEHDDEDLREASLDYL